jgi:hypothetical protein
VTVRFDIIRGWLDDRGGRRFGLKQFDKLSRRGA